MDNKELIKELIRFKDKAFCNYTESQAEHIWRKIGKHIPNASRIQTEWGHIKCGHGRIQACQALDTEIKIAIDKLK